MSRQSSAALALAYILNPLVTLLEKRYAVRRVTSVSVGLVLLVLMGSTLLLAGTAQLVQLAGNIPTYTRDGIKWLDQTVPGLFAGTEAATPAESAPAEASDASDNGASVDAGPSTEPAVVQAADGGAFNAANLAEAHRERLVGLASEHGLAVGRAVLAYIAGALSNVFYWLSLVVLLPLYTFFFLLHFNDIVHVVRDHLPAEYRPTVVRAVTTVDEAISNFFRGRLVVCLIMAVLTGLGWLLIGVPYSLPLGGLMGLLNLVPFMSVLALPPAMLLTYFDVTGQGGNWVIPVALVFGVYALVQGIESFVLNPTIQAKASGLHSVTTVIALLIGGQLAGLLGMLLAIPIASTLKSLGREYLLPEIQRLASSEGDASTDSANDAPGAASPPAPDGESSTNNSV